MSDEPQDVTAGKQPVCGPERPPTQDLSPKGAASGGDGGAALARAIAEAERSAGPARRDGSRPAASPDPAKVEAARAPAAAPRPALRRAAAAVLALAGLGGAAAGGYGFALHRPADPALLAAIAGLEQGQADIVRLTGDVKSLKVAVDALRDSFDGARLDGAQRQARFLDRIERIERAGQAPQDLAVRVAALGDQLGRIEAVAKEPGVQLAGLGERLDRIERQVAASARPAAPVAVPTASPEPAAQAGAVAKQPAKEVAKEPAKEPPKEPAVEGWVLREVYDGVALIEGRNRRLVEVGPGEQVPGVGRVEAIERRGRRWVVVTAKGLIAMPR